MSYFLIHSLTSDLDIEREFAQWLRIRALEQKFLYMGDGASKYYSSVKLRELAWGISKERIDMFTNFVTPQMNKDVIWAIISLGCWDAIYEAAIIDSLVKQGYRIAYFWVDASRSMLTLAHNSIKDLDCEMKKLICADILSEEFRSEIKNLTSYYPYRIFSFFDWTYWNMNQAFITDSLYWILQKNDLLWFNVWTRISLDVKDEIKIFERYTERFLDNADVQKWIFYALKDVWVSYKSWKLRLDLQREASSGTLLLRFSFVFEERVILDYRWERFHYLPWEFISLLDVRVFNADKLISFFREHEFSFIDKRDNILDNTISSSQFLFRKA